MKKINWNRLILASFVLLGVAFWSFIGGYIAYQLEHGLNDDSNGASQQLPAKAPITQDADLVQKSKSLGIDVKEITLEYGMPEGGDTRNAEFTFTSDGSINTYKIVVKPGLSTNDTLTSLAHEYYHYYWNRNPKQKEAAPLARTLYNAYQPLKERMNIYLEKGMTVESEEFADEIVAIGCTEVTPDVVSEDFQKYCYMGVPNRSTIQAIY